MVRHRLRIEHKRVSDLEIYVLRLIKHPPGLLHFYYLFSKTFQIAPCVYRVFMIITFMNL